MKESLDEGSVLGKCIVEICENINSNIQAASIQVTDPTILKQYKTLTKRMLDMIGEYQYMFENMISDNIST